ncbi:beta-ketoacyl-ACP synthase II [soil metagenome]
MTSTPRIAVTGIGLITPLAVCREESWKRIVEGNGGINHITAFNACEYPVRIAGEIPGFDPTTVLDRKEARKTDRVIQLAVAATREALDHADLAVQDANPERVGVFVGTALGGISTFEAGVRSLQERGPRRVSPFFIPMTLADMPSGYVSIQLGAKGPNMGTVSACASGAHALGEAMETIARGDADVMLAGGVEAAVTPSSVAGFAAAGALSTRNDEADRASRPFDAQRDGFVLGEGGAILVLEREDHARQRGAQILAYLSGYGSAADAHHITQPGLNGEGATRAMQKAIARADLSPGDISYVNAHGTSTPLNDKFETMALKAAFGESVPPVSSTKGATGHLLGAAPAIEAAFSVLAIRDRIIPPTINYEHPDPNCDLDYVPGDARTQDLRHVLSNSFGFGGHNAVLVFSAPESSGR